MSTRDDLMGAIRSRDAARVLTLLSDDVRLASSTETGPSALLLTAYTGQVELAGQMVSLGLMPDLWESAALGWPEQVQAQLDARPDLLNSHSGDGFTALALASYFGRTEVVRQLLLGGANTEIASTNAQRVRPIHSALSGHHLDVLWLLLRRGADVNARQERGYTPLHQAAHAGLIEAARLLLAAGAETSVLDDASVSPAEMARMEGHQAVAQLIGLAEGV